MDTFGRILGIIFAFIFVVGITIVLGILMVIEIIIIIRIINYILRLGIVINGMCNVAVDVM